MTLLEDGTDLPDKAWEWLNLMQTYPSDGWDGAATMIASHDRVVCEFEQELDKEHPGWHNDLKDLHDKEVPQRRTKALQ